MLTETLLIILFSSANLSLALGKCAGINFSQTASGMILQNHRLLPVSIFSIKIASDSLKRVTELIFKISTGEWIFWSKLKLCV
jgi:hypothetical protein